MTAAQIAEERNKLWQKAKFFLDKADAEKRGLTAEEQGEYDRLTGEIDKLGERYADAQRRERAAEIEAELRARPERRTAPAPAPAHRPAGGNRAAALRDWLTRPAQAPLSADQVDNARSCGVDLNARQFSFRLGGPPTEQRALGVTTGTAGGAFATYDLAQGFDRAMLAYGNARQLVRVLRTSQGVALPIPTITDTANQATIVAEAGSIGVTPDPTTGTVTLGAFMYTSGGVQLSLQLVQDEIVDLTTLVPDLLGERIARAVNAHVVAGTGSGQPFGIFPRATASGVVVGGTAAAPTFTGDNFIDLLHNLDPAYRNQPGAGFMMHDTIVQRVRKLKDNNGQYLWQPAMQMGQPDRLLGFPLYVNQACPTLAVNARVAAFGDYSRYYWREVADVQLYRLDELYIMTGQIAFMALYRADGNLIVPAAVRTLAAPAS